MLRSVEQLMFFVQFLQETIMLFEISEQRANPSFLMKCKSLLPESKSVQVCGIDSRFY